MPYLYPRRPALVTLPVKRGQHPFLEVRANQVIDKHIRARHGRYCDYLGELGLLYPSMESYSRRR